MIGIIVFIGVCALIYRQFAEAAHEFHKSRVGFGFAGIGFFIAANFLLQILAGIVLAFTAPHVLYDTGSLLLVSLCSYVLAILVALWVRTLFKKAWRKQVKVNDQILDN